MVVRERRPDAAGGLVIKQLASRLDRVMTEFSEKPYEELIQLIRTGPPRFSPFQLKQVEELSNTVEFYVHTEDIRRARPDWAPRELPFAPLRPEETTDGWKVRLTADPQVWEVINAAKTAFFISGLLFADRLI